MESELIFDKEQCRRFWGILPASFRPDLEKTMIIGNDALVLKDDCPKEIKQQFIKQFPEYIRRHYSNFDALY